MSAKEAPPGTPVLTGYWAKEYARLQAEVQELTAILNTHRRQYADGRLPQWTCEATDEEIIDILLPASQSEVADLRAALAKGRSLVEDMDELMPSQAIEDEDGFINSYRIPVGPWHRILGWARGGW